MSNFRCEVCSTDILEGPGGHYVTGCPHYPLEARRETKNKGETMKPKGPFKYMGSNTDEQSDVFEALFPLPDDGTPGGEQFLRIQVETQGDQTYMRLWTRSQSEDYELGEIESAPLPAVRRLLYGAARVKTVDILEPL